MNKTAKNFCLLGNPVQQKENIARRGNRKSVTGVIILNRAARKSDIWEYLQAVREGTCRFLWDEPFKC